MAAAHDPHKAEFLPLLEAVSAGAQPVANFNTWLHNRNVPVSTLSHALLVLEKIITHRTLPWPENEENPIIMIHHELEERVGAKEADKILEHSLTAHILKALLVNPDLSVAKFILTTCNASCINKAMEWNAEMGKHWAHFFVAADRNIIYSIFDKFDSHFLKKLMSLDCLGEKFGDILRENTHLNERDEQEFLEKVDALTVVAKHALPSQAGNFSRRRSESEKEEGAAAAKRPANDQQYGHR